MQAKEDPGPRNVEHELYREQRHWRYGGRETGRSPDKPGGDRHQNEERGPDGPEDSVGRVPRRLFDRSIPALNFRRGGDGPESTCTETDGDEDDEAYPAGAVRQCVLPFS